MVLSRSCHAVSQHTYAVKCQNNLRNFTSMKCKKKYSQIQKRTIIWQHATMFGFFFLSWWKWMNWPKIMKKNHHIYYYINMIELEKKEWVRESVALLCSRGFPKRHSSFFFFTSRCWSESPLPPGSSTTPTESLGTRQKPCSWSPDPPPRISHPWRTQPRNPPPSWPRSPSSSWPPPPACSRPSSSSLRSFLPTRAKAKAPLSAW